MNLLLRLYTDFIGGRPAVGVLLFRIVTGLALMQHGWTKIQHPLSWMGPDGPPALIQALAAVSEFGGGLALVLGLLTPIACLGVFCTMIGALVMVHIPHGDPWVGKGASMEPAITYLIASVLLFCTGPGVLSLDSRLFGTRMRSRLSELQAERKKVAV